MKKSQRLVLALSALFSSSAAYAVNVCTDSNGQTVYQQQPCLALQPHAENAPIKTRALTAEVANETVKRFRKSLSNRDSTTATRFLAPAFTASIQTSKGSVDYSKENFAGMMTRVLNAASSFKSTAKCSPPTIANQVATVTCDVHETLTLLKETLQSVSTDMHRIALVNGAAMLIEVSSVQREK